MPTAKDKEQLPRTRGRRKAPRQVHRQEEEELASILAAEVEKEVEVEVPDNKAHNGAEEEATLSKEGQTMQRERTQLLQSTLPFPRVLLVCVG